MAMASARTIDSYSDEEETEMEPLSPLVFGITPPEIPSDIIWGLNQFGGGYWMAQYAKARKLSKPQPPTPPVEPAPYMLFEYGWTLWHSKNDRFKKWMDCMKVGGKFRDSEEFKRMYVNHSEINDLEHNTDRYLFKDGIKPMWEDPKNVNGGRWVINVPRHDRRSLVKYWHMLIVIVLCGRYRHATQIVCGLAANIRLKGNKISIWTRDAADIEANLRIGLIVKKHLELDSKIFYEVHRDSMRKQSSVLTPRYVV